MRATAGELKDCRYSNVVDLYDSGTGRWSTAQLSQARGYLSATSVGTVAIFAGGWADDDDPEFSDVVDLYDSETGRWSTAQLSQARPVMSATSVGTVAIFAGGGDNNCKLLRIAFFCCVNECWLLL
jgi:hypothetical protein